MSGKKSFKGTNPALSYIGSAPKSPDVHTDVDMHTYTHTHDAPSPSVSEPAARLLPKHDHTNTDTAAYTHTYTPSHSRRENKSRRLQLLIKPSIHAGVSELAAQQDTSINDMINIILENHLRKGAN